MNEESTDPELINNIAGINECTHMSLDETREEIFNLLTSAANVQKELMKQTTEDKFKLELHVPIPTILCDDIFYKLDIEYYEQINYNIFIEAFCEEIDNSSNKIKDLLVNLPRDLEINKNNTHENNIQLSIKEFGKVIQVLTLIQSAYQLFYKEDPNFTKKLKIDTNKLKEEGLASINENLLSLKVKSINFENLVKLIIEQVTDQLKKQSKKINLKLQQKLFIWYKYIQGESIVNTRKSISRSRATTETFNNPKGSVQQDMYQLNDDFNKEIDSEMDALRKKNLNSTEKLLEKILNVNLDEVTNESNNENPIHDDNDPMIKKTSDRRKRNLASNSTSLNTLNPSIPVKHNRRFSEFTDVFEEMDKISKNLSMSTAIAQTGYEYIHQRNNKNEKFYQTPNLQKNDITTTKQKSFKPSNNRFSIILKEDMMNFQVMSSMQYKNMYDEIAGSLELDENVNPDSKTEVNIHDLDKKQFNSIKRYLDKTDDPENFSSDLITDIHAKQIKIEYMHVNKTSNNSANKSTNDRHEKNIQKLRDDLNFSRVESEADDNMTNDKLRQLLDDVEDYSTKLEEKQVELTYDFNEVKKIVNEQDEVINELRFTLKNSQNEKNDEIEKVKESLTKEWINKELKLKLNLEEQSGKYDQLNADYEKLTGENDMLKKLTDDLNKNSELLSNKLEKNKTKLEMYETSKNLSNKDVQCNIQIANDDLATNLIKDVDQYKSQDTNDDQDKASLVSDDAEEIIKGKLTSNIIIELQGKLDIQEQEYFQEYVSTNFNLSRHRRSSLLQNEDKNDDGSNEELKEKILEQEDEIRNIENELSLKSKNIHDLNSKLARIQIEYDSMVNKNRQINMDLVEARLLFKQQCCVLVQFMKISRKQLTKFKNYIQGLIFNQEHYNKDYKYFGRKLSLKYETLIIKNFKLDQKQTYQHRNQLNYRKLYTQTFSSKLDNKNIAKQIYDRNKIELKKLRVNFSLIKNESRRSTFKIKLNYQTFSQLEVCRQTESNINLDLQVQNKVNQIANEILNKQSNLIIESWRLDKYFILIKENSENNLKYKNLFIYINNSNLFFRGLKDELEHFIYRDGCIIHKHQKGKDIQNTIQEQFLNNQIQFENMDTKNQDTYNEKPVAMFADLPMFNLKVFYTSLFDS